VAISPGIVGAPFELTCPDWDDEKKGWPRRRKGYIVACDW
jgi:hypothetical protein